MSLIGEQLLTVTAAAKLVNTSPHTVRRWILRGDKRSGIKLEHCVLPGGLRTSVEALRRFEARLRGEAMTDNLLPPTEREIRQRAEAALEVARQNGWL